MLLKPLKNIKKYLKAIYVLPTDDIPPTVSTPSQNESMQQLQSDQIQHSHSGYDSYLTGPPPSSSPFGRRSPVFPGSSLFQVKNLNL